MNVTDCWWGTGEPIEKLKFGLESIGGVLSCWVLLRTGFLHVITVM